MPNPLIMMQQYGQSPWYDNIRRSFITSGDLQALIDGDGLRGVTSNPAIFEKAIASSTDYDDALQALEPQQDMDAKGLYEHLAVADIQAAADVMAPVYRQTRKRDGYVSLEVSPYLAHNTEGTIAEARRLWQAIDRDNVMIKVPATAAGIPAIQQLISEGINVNVTLLFHIQVYEAVAEAYLSGLETCVAQGRDPSGVASVASFFISRIDSAVDGMIAAKLKTVTRAGQRSLLRSLLGNVAIANAKLTYQRYKAIFSGTKWQTLEAQGAQTQRLLWASTSTKNPAYRDVRYVDELIGPDTVNTLPPATIDAFLDHGNASVTIDLGVEDARELIDRLPTLGVDLDAILARLLDEGVASFAKSFEDLLASIREKQEKFGATV